MQRGRGAQKRLSRETPAFGEIDLGQKLKAVRTRKRVTLQQVADAANLSKSFISQVEAGAANPSIGSLKKIAQGLGIPLGALLDDERTPALAPTVASAPPDGQPRDRTREVQIVRRDRRKMLVWPGKDAKTYLLTPDLQRKLEVILDVEEPGHTSGEERYCHEGEEFGFVLEGRYEVTVGDQVFVLEEGDSIYYPSDIPHKVRVLGDRPAKTLWVITPPSF